MSWLSPLISLAAVIVAIASITIQNRNFKKQRIPVVAPVIKNFKLELPKLNLDWNNCKIDDYFSETTIPVYNFGGTPAFNLTYNFAFRNFDEIKRELPKLKIEGYEVGIHENTEGILSNDHYRYEITVVGENFAHSLPLSTSQIKRRADVIPAEGSVEINLPSYYVILINCLFRDISFRNIKRNKVFPELELTLTYNDINFKSFQTKYIIKIDEFRQLHLNYNEYSFDAKFSLIPESYNG
ncbi:MULTISPECIES: hypothetical protein [Bacillus]|uniref:hypothetical protein n=1 Tax=Bacillus TaxID=1386 RepID=UPI00273B38B0|nr:hypothetical protein [Bacillus halotolerans]MDP4527085.1 hypothetical protein [Bacillus halotolerans]